jgi:4-alpha-glucanotransferase
VEFDRESGVLLHPTSLPGAYGMGEIGPEARNFVDALAAMGQRLWQILPHGPTSYGDSPYQSLSTFAGNHLLISLEDLVAEGLLNPDRLKKFPAFPAAVVDYGPVIEARMEVLRSVCRSFERRASSEIMSDYESFCQREAYWLEEYALFYSLKDAHDLRPWTEWPAELGLRDGDALEKARRKYHTAIRNVKIMQYLFNRQWQALRAYAHSKRVRLIGDIPIFVAHDSADVWANPELYYLDGRGEPIVIAGVPPDYFSATGQRWGNPLYRWDIHQHTDFDWWIRRIKKIFEMVDIVRIDHFRGFEAYWEIPGHEPTAINGRWVDGPREAIFDAMIKAIGTLPIIAEDLGIITEGVEALRDKYHFPGMRILQFAFGTDAKAADYRPDNYPRNCVVYTGTHDNDTTVGWFWSNAGEGSTRTQEEIEEERRTILEYVGTDGSQIHWDMIALACKSNAATAIYPLQDLLGLGSEARMNVPGVEGGNWRWRFTWDQLTADIVQRMHDICAWADRLR